MAIKRHPGQLFCIEAERVKHAFHMLLAEDRWKIHWILPAPLFLHRGLVPLDFGPLRRRNDVEERPAADVAQPYSVEKSRRCFDDLEIEIQERHWLRH